jgi:CHASE3 domain sensor protein
MLPLLLLLGIGVVAYRSISSLTSTSHLVAHTQQVLEHIAEVLSLMKDAETGQRGYIITADEAYLEPYQAGSVGVPTVIKELRQLTADNPSQQPRVATS